MNSPGARAVPARCASPFPLFSRGLRGRRGNLKLADMSKAEILQELPKLKPDERQEVLERLWDLEDQDLVNGLGPSPEEKANCRDYFERQLDLVKPRFICCLGAVAAKSVLNTTTGITKLRSPSPESFPRNT